MSFRPSPFQTQTPTFAPSSSPLDQIINGVQPGPSSLPHPSSRGALVERAFSLTRGAGPSGKSQRTQEGMSAGGRTTSHAPRGRPHQAAAAPPSSRALAHQHAQQQERRIATDYSEPSLNRQAPSASYQRAQPDWQTTNLNDPALGWHESDLTASGESSSERQRIRRLREVRLSQQQQQQQQQQHQYQQQQYQQHQQQNYHRQQPESGARTPGTDQRYLNSAQRGPSQGRPYQEQFGHNSNAGASSSSQDSVVANESSNASHSFVVYGRPDMSSGASPLRNVHAPEQDYRDDVDRIAQEVRGLTMRRRQSVDTVRSSEFGEDGRWAKAWAGSDDGQDDEEEEEMDLQAMRARDLTEFDVEGKSTPQTHYVTGGLGALGELGSLQGLRAAMDHSANRRQHQGQTTGLPPIQNVTSNVHTVSLTPLSSRASPSLRQAPSHSANTAVHNQQRLDTQIGAHTAQLNRRDTIMSVAGEIDEMPQDGDVSNRQAHLRRGSNATVASNTSSNTLGNAHVMVWPPTPAASVAGSSHGDEDSATMDGSARNHNRDTLRATPRTTEMGVGQSALVEEYDEPKQLEERKTARPQVQHPISPSSLLAQEGRQSSSMYGPASTSVPSTGRPAVQDNPLSREMLVFNGFEDPNQLNQSDAHDGLGKMRRKAIADHDGRESLVSDLDVETLRLDGSSVAGGSSFDERDPRRDSTSTIGTISSVELNEQRRRRSQLERRDAMLSGQDDRRSSTATLRSGDQSAPSPRYGYKQADYTASQRISAPGSVGFDQVARPPVPPKRSNTQPEDELQQQYPNRNANQSGSAQSSPWMSRQQSAPGESTQAMQSSSSMQSGATNPSRRMPASASSTTTASPTLRGGSSVAKSSSRNGASNASAHANSVAAPMQSQAEKFLTLGISYHESGDLSRSAYHFERSAKVDGGCVVGMCMWGMALREGWGVRVDQKRGFEWISRAAARAGEMMSGNDGTRSGRSEAELRAVRSELKLSVYELGKCFCYGWGAKMDKQMALEYFELAARLGDADAQAEAGALLAAGKGCKKDLKRAAMYYRMAEAQGYDTVGLSWIHKDKYDPAPVVKTK